MVVKIPSNDDFLCIFCSLVICNSSSTTDLECAHVFREALAEIQLIRDWWDASSRASQNLSLNRIRDSQRSFRVPSKMAVSFFSLLPPQKWQIFNDVDSPRNEFSSNLTNWKNKRGTLRSSTFSRPLVNSNSPHLFDEQKERKGNLVI